MSAHDYNVNRNVTLSGYANSATGLNLSSLLSLVNLFDFKIDTII